MNNLNLISKDDKTWDEIIKNEGSKFKTKRGKVFTYELTGNAMQIIGKKTYTLSKGNFLKAFDYFDPNSLMVMPKNIVGRSYVWGVFNGILD